MLINARDQYYAFDVVPEFWNWLVYQADIGNVKMPIETMEEILEGPTKYGRDPLYDWIHDIEVRSKLLLKEDVDPATVQFVLDTGYGTNLTETELETIGADPFLIAHALHDSAHRCVISNEVRKPSKKREKRRVPDACDDVAVKCHSTVEFIRLLEFRTNWSEQELEKLLR